MTKRELEEVLRAWKAAQLSPNEALRRTAGEWRKLAAALWHRWRRRMPTWTSFEDVHQVVLMNVPRLVEAYRDVGPGSRMGGYVCQNVLRAAEKAIHRWRNARRGGCNPRHEPSRFELPECLLADDGDGDGWERAVARATPRDTVEDHLVEREALDAVLERELAQADDVGRAVAIQALVATGGHVALAASALWRSPRARLFCAVRTEKAARRLVERTAGEIGERLTAA